MTDALSQDAGERGEQILEILGSAVPGELYALFRLARVGGEALYTDLSCRGDRAASALWQTCIGTPLRAPWTPAAPHHRDINRFRRGFAGNEPEQVGVWCRFYQPVGLRDQRRMLVYDGDTFCGWIGIVRAEDARPFDAGDARRLARIAPRVQRLVVAHHRLLSGERPEGQVHLVMDGAGVVRMASPDARAWLRRSRREILATWTRRCDAGRSPPAGLVIGGMRARPFRMEADAGTTWLWTLTPTDAPRLEPARQLGPRAREVCEFAAAGATVAEIARHLDMSPETVKSHLKRAYRVLGVASRVELARFLRHGP